MSQCRAFRQWRVGCVGPVRKRRERTTSVDPTDARKPVRLLFERIDVYPVRHRWAVMGFGFASKVIASSKATHSDPLSSQDCDGEENQQQC
jgi:hypothetical protein